MESSSGPNCADLLNIGIVDGAGVGILWLAFIKWIFLAMSPCFIKLNSLNSAVGQVPCKHKLFGLEVDWEGLLDYILRIIPAGSFLYTSVQAIYCKDALVIFLVLWIYYQENGFRKAGVGKWPSKIVDYVSIQRLNPIVIATCGIAISHGGALRQVGIAGIVLTFVTAYCIPEDENGRWVSEDPRNGIHLAFIFPLILACLVTIIVRDRSLWTPRPQNTLEFVLLYSRIAFSTGAIDFVKLACKTVYHCFSSPFIVEKKIPNDGPFSSNQDLEMQVA